MNRTTARLTSLIAIPVALASAAILSACSPTETDKPVALSDGINVTLGDVQGLDLMVASQAQGQPGRLLGGFTNSGDTSETVTVAPEGAGPQTVTVGAGKTVYLSGDDDEAQTVLFDTTSAAPGAMVSVTFTAGSATDNLKVPVVGNTFTEYATLIPTAGPTS